MYINLECVVGCKIYEHFHPYKFYPVWPLKSRLVISVKYRFSLLLTLCSPFALCEGKRQKMNTEKKGKRRFSSLDERSEITFRSTDWQTKAW